MAWPSSLPLIDPFNRVESPLSDGGRWYSPKTGGGTVAGAGADYQETHQFPFPSLNETIKHQNWSDVLHPPSGPAMAIRTADPGVGTDMAIELFCVGLMGIAWRLLRYDWGGNGYLCAAGDSGSGTYFKIWRSHLYSLTLLGQTNLSSVSSGNLYIGAMAQGNEISMWYADVFSPNPRIHALSVFDNTYTAGFIGFGGEGGVFGSMAQQPCYGSTSLSTFDGVWVTSVRDPHAQTGPQVS